MSPKEILALDAARPGLAGVVRAGALLFTSGCDGHRDSSGAVLPARADNVEAQCESAYSGVAEKLAAAGASPAAIVRIDHATTSQEWLPRRQTIRQKHYGRPAPFASTGIAMRMEGINLVTACAIGVADPADKAVLVSGPRYGMSNISSLVRGGPFYFVSGIRATVDPRSGVAVPEETPEALKEQARLAYLIIVAILAEAGAGAERILRLDCYLRSIGRAGEEAAMRQAVLGTHGGALTTIGAPLGGRGEIEVTALALAPGLGNPAYFRATDEGPAAVSAGGMVFIGECVAARPEGGDRRGQLHSALSRLDAALRRAGSTSRDVARLDVYLRDIHFAPAASDMLRQHFVDAPPAVFMAGAELEDGLEVKLAAIALERG